MFDTKSKAQFLSEITDNQRIIFKVCHLYTISKDDFSDLYQEIVLQLWKSYKTFRGSAKLSTWIYRVALNTALYKLRKDKQRIPFQPLVFKHETINAINDSLTSEILDELKALIGRLSEIEKALIALYLDRYSYKEIADIVGISKTNVATRINRIKHKLKIAHKKKSEVNNE